MEGILTQGFKGKRAKTPLPDAPPPSSLPPQAPPDMEYSKNATATSSSSPHGRPASSGDGGPRFLPASVSGHLGIVSCIPYLLFDTSLVWCWVHSVASRLYYGVSGSRRKRVHNHPRKPVGLISIKWDMSYHVFSILLAEIRAVNCGLVKELKCRKKSHIKCREFSFIPHMSDR